MNIEAFVAFPSLLLLIRIIWLVLPSSDWKAPFKPNRYSGPMSIDRLCSVVISTEVSKDEPGMIRINNAKRNALIERAMLEYFVPITS